MATQQIAVTLDSSIVYVSGTVNGKDYTFTLSDTTSQGSIWSATVDRAQNDIYEVQITAIDSLGNTTSLSTVIYYGLHGLITDRTQFDVDYVLHLEAKGYFGMTDEEKAEWDASLKGAYNYTDLNRVEAAVAYLCNRFPEFGYSMELPTHINWEREDIPTPDDFERYIANIATLRAFFEEHKSSPSPPSADISSFGYQEANDVEQILMDLEKLFNNISSAWLFLDDIYAGEV